jgi:capsular polysaccharide transport system permease protein
MALATASSAATDTRSFWRGLMIQSEVVFAVILRETRTRFGRNKLGYLWALLEPTIMIVTFHVFYRLANRTAPVGMDLFSFIATGVVPYTLFMNSVTRVAESVNSNKALLFYPQVQPLDLAIARSLLEAATFAAVFILLLGGHAIITKDLEIDEPLRVIFGMGLVSLLGSSLGLVFCGLQQFSTVAERARGPMLRPLFWISGIFFTVESLPESVRGVMMTNPLLHCTELVRDGWFESYSDTHTDVFYVLAWVLGLMVVGLVLERAVRRRIELS